MKGKLAYVDILLFLCLRRGKMRTDPDFVPSLFAHTSARQRQKTIYANSRFEHTQQMKRKRTETVARSSDDAGHKTVAPSSDDTEQDGTVEVQTECTTLTDEHSYSQAIRMPGLMEPCSNAACQVTFKALTDECTRLRAEEVDELSLNEVQGNYEMVHDLTGLPSYAKFMNVFTLLSGFLKPPLKLTLSLRSVNSDENVT